VITNSFKLHHIFAPQNNVKQQNNPKKELGKSENTKEKNWANLRVQINPLQLYKFHLIFAPQIDVKATI